jgi:3-phosphoshikimate 1-carboxyvinyltransferase
VPLSIEGGSLQGGRTALDARESSQYLSALLMAALRAREPVDVEVVALTSEPYVAVTLEATAAFGGAVAEVAPGRFHVEPGLAPPARATVEGDYSAACYPAAAAALTGGRVRLLGLRRDSAQGDRAFFELLARMGARVEPADDGWELASDGRLAAVEADLASMPDQVPTLAALAPFARGVTRITGVPHLRIKESDRLAAMAEELARAGAEVVERPDGLTIPGVWAEAKPPAEPVVMDPHGDHRIAMSLALLGLRRPGISVAEPAVVAKSYPDFWRDLDRLLSE